MEVIPTVTGSISFFSSISLLYRVLRVGRSLPQKTRDQLLCGSLGFCPFRPLWLLLERSGPGELYVAGILGPARIRSASTLSSLSVTTCPIPVYRDGLPVVAQGVSEYNCSLIHAYTCTVCVEGAKRRTTLCGNLQLIISSLVSSSWCCR